MSPPRIFCPAMHELCPRLSCIESILAQPDRCFCPRRSYPSRDWKPNKAPKIKKREKLPKLLSRRKGGALDGGQKQPPYLREEVTAAPDSGCQLTPSHPKKSRTKRQST